MKGDMMLVNFKKQKRVLRKNTLWTKGMVMGTKQSTLKRSYMFSKAAFTLAEVLITLAVIGIIVVLTIPTLVKNYKKEIVTTRLEHFATTWRNAYRLVQFENGDEFYGDLIPYNPQSAKEHYKKYFLPYYKTIQLEESEYGVTAAFANGSGVYFYRIPLCGQSSQSACTYIVFCPYYKDCRSLSTVNLEELGTYSAAGEMIVDGVKTFTFYMNGNSPNAHTAAQPNTARTTLRTLCAAQPGYCSTLIERDGWTIKDDYPHKL